MMITYLLVYPDSVSFAAFVCLFSIVYCQVYGE